MDSSKVAAATGWGLGWAGLGGTAEGTPCSLSQQERSLGISGEGAWRSWVLCPTHPHTHTAEAWGEFSQPLGVEAAGLGELQPLQVLLEDLPSLLQRAERRCCCGATRSSPKGQRRADPPLSQRPRDRPGQGRSQAEVHREPVWVSDGADVSGTMGPEPEMADPGGGFSGPSPRP